MKRNKIATIGFFDGVHKGHQFLFEHLGQLASERGLEPLIVTFEDHPRRALDADYVPRLLTSLEERTAKLNQYGEVLVFPFEEIQPLSAKEFMLRLRDEYGVTALLMGYDHRFGSDRLKHPQDYRHIGEQCGVEVITLSEYTEGEWHVSSTEIRMALETGNIAVANELLGHPYSLRGRVVHGKAIGRTIGFPTANIIVPEDKFVVRRGVYATCVYLGNRKLYGVTNIGLRPTVEDADRELCETYIFDFDEDIYGALIRVELFKFIRDEKPFSGVDELKEAVEENKR